MHIEIKILFHNILQFEIRNERKMKWNEWWFVKVDGMDIQ